MATNAKQPGKWPSYAAGCREESVVLAKKIAATARNAQLAILAGQKDQAIILCGDIRDDANGIVWQMVQAAAGIYEESATDARRSNGTA